MTSTPQLSIVIATRAGCETLTLPLPGLQQQTMASEIELILVAPRGVVSKETLDGVTGLHSVRLLEVDEVSNRGREAGKAILEARAPFVALHENHTRADTHTFERLVATHTDRTAATGPLMCAANPENAWGLAMYALGYGHCAPPARVGPRPLLPNHNSVYKTDVLRKFGSTLPERMMREGALQEQLIREGFELLHAPDTKVWHLNESRPKQVLGDSYYLGRGFGAARGSDWPLWKKLAYAGAWPVIAALTANRFLQALHRTPEASHRLLPACFPAAMAASAFAAGEVHGYFTDDMKISDSVELHEFNVAGRLAGRAPAAPWLLQAIEALPEATP